MTLLLNTCLKTGWGDFIIFLLYLRGFINMFFNVQQKIFKAKRFEWAFFSHHAGSYWNNIVT